MIWDIPLKDELHDPTLGKKLRKDELLGKQYNESPVMKGPLKNDLPIMIKTTMITKRTPVPNA